MKYTECTTGRVFLLRLEDEDTLHEVIEDFARRENVKRALVNFVGGIGSGHIVVGPEDADVTKGVNPMTYRIEGVHEAAGLGTIVPNEAGEPVLHMHAAMGRKGDTRTGCVRTGVDVWTIGEVVVVELLECDAVRRIDPETGFELLEV